VNKSEDKKSFYFCVSFQRENAIRKCSRLKHELLQIASKQRGITSEAATAIFHFALFGVVESYVGGFVDRVSSIIELISEN
jgi:hypothetical protein